MTHPKLVLPALSVVLGSLFLAGCVTTTPPQDSDLFTHDPDLAPASSTTHALPLEREAPPVNRKILRQAAPLPASGAAPYRNRAAQQQGKVRLSFDNTDIHEVVTALSSFLDRHFLVDPRVKGTLTLHSDGEVPASTAFQLLDGALRLQGFAIVDVGEVSRVVPIADARLQGSAVNDPTALGGVATRSFRLNYEKADALVAALKPLLAPDSVLTAYPNNNTVVITDSVDNLERIAALIQSIDTPTALHTVVLPIYNGVANDIASLANDILEQDGNNAQRDITVMADPRSNSVIIRSSSPGRSTLARNLIVELDNVQSDPGNFHVVYLRNAQARYLAGVLRGLLTGESPEDEQGGSESMRAALGNKSNSEPSRSKSGGKADKQSSSDTTLERDSGGGTSSFSASGVTVQADITTNALIIAAPEPMYRSLRRVIDMLDQRRSQVLVESLIVEVTENDAAELGIQWMRNNGRFIGGANLGGTGFNTSATNTINMMPNGLSLGIVDGTVNIPGVGQIMNLNLLARALQTKGGVNILSTPNILTLDNEPASILVGKTVPFVSGQYVTSGNTSGNPFQTIEREEIGLKLNIRPQISEGGTVKLDIYQEISNIDEGTKIDGGIVTNKRSIDTSVLLDDGQIMVLGGLLEDRVTRGSDAVPILGSIPVLGALFRYDKRQREKTNLMIFLRPYVIRDAQAGRGLTQHRYNYMRAQQQRGQPASHPLLPDMNAPVLPPLRKPAQPRAELDLRQDHWQQTREQDAPATRQSSQVRQQPAPPAPAAEQLHARLPANVGVRQSLDQDYAAAPAGQQTILIADTDQEGLARRIAARVQRSGLRSYVLAGPGGTGYQVRTDVPAQDDAVDTSLTLLAELGYQAHPLETP